MHTLHDAPYDTTEGFITVRELADILRVTLRYVQREEGSTNVCLQGEFRHG
jgi:hypothetical protein